MSKSDVTMIRTDKATRERLSAAAAGGPVTELVKTLSYADAGMIRVCERLRGAAEAREGR